MGMRHDARGAHGDPGLAKICQHVVEICNAYALRGSLLGANLASNLHETLVGKRER